MATKAYFVVSVAEDFYQNRYEDVLRDLEAVPEVESIERISGTCDLLVKVGVPVAAIFVANKTLAKEWVKSLHMLKIEPFRTEDIPSSVTQASAAADRAVKIILMKGR